MALDANDLKQMAAQTEQLLKKQAMYNEQHTEKLLRTILGSSKSTKTRDFDWSRMESSSRGWSSSLDDSSDEIDKHTDGLKDLTKSITSYNNGIRSTHDALKKFSANVGNSSQSLKSQSAILSGLIEGTDFSNDKLDAFSHKIFNSAKSLSLFNKTITDGYFINKWGHKEYIDNIHSLDNFQNTLAKNVDFLEKASKEHSNLAAEIERVTSLEKSKLGQGDLILRQIADEYNLKGKSNAQIAHHIKQTKNEIYQLSKVAAKEQLLAKTTEWVNDRFGIFGKLITGATTPMGLVTAGFALLASSIPGLYNQFKVLADSGMIRAGMDIKRAQLDLGVSFEAATKIFQENARNLANVENFSHFVRAMNAGQEAFMKLGVNTEQAAQMVSDVRKNMVEAGVNIKDTEHFNKAIKVQTAAFGKLKATTGLSVEQFNAFNNEMMNSEVMQETLNGLSETERLNKIQDMNTFRQNLVNLGMTSEKAQKAMMTIADLGKQKVSERFNQAAKFQVAASMAGLSNTKELSDIVRKGKRATAEEQTKLAQATAKMSKTFDSMGLDTYGSEIISELGTEYMGPLATVGRDMALGADAQGKITDKQASNLEKEMELKDSTVKALKAISRLEQLKSDPAVRAIAGLALIAVGLLKTLASSFKHFIPSIDKFKLANTSENQSIIRSISTLSQRTQEATNATKAAETPSAAERIQERIESTSEDMDITRAEQHERQQAGHVTKENAPTTDSKDIKRSKVEEIRRKRGKQRIPRATSAVSASETIVESTVEAASHLAPQVADASEVVEKTTGKIGSFFNMVKGGMKSIFSLGTKFLKFLPVIGTLFTAVFDGAAGFMDAEKVFNIAEGQAASTQQKILAAVGGVVKGMLFGLGDGFVDSTLRNLDDALTKSEVGEKLAYTGKLLKETFSRLWGGVKSIFGITEDAISFFDMSWIAGILDAINGTGEVILNVGTIISSNLKIMGVKTLDVFAGIGNGITNFVDFFIYGFEKLSNAYKQAELYYAKAVKIISVGLIDNVDEKQKAVDESNKKLADMEKNKAEMIKSQELGNKNRENEIANIEKSRDATILSTINGEQLYKEELKALKTKEKTVKAQEKSTDLTKLYGEQQLMSLSSLSADALLTEQINKNAKIVGTESITPATQVKEIVSNKSAVNTAIDQSKVKTTEINETSSEEAPKTSEQLLTEISIILTKMKETGDETNKINKEQLELLTALVETNKDASEFYKLKHTGVPGNNTSFFNPMFNNSLNAQIYSI